MNKKKQKTNNYKSNSTSKSPKEISVVKIDYEELAKAIIKENKIDSFEYRKTRMDNIYRLFYPFGIITLFGLFQLSQNNPHEINDGYILFLGLSSYLFIMLLAMTRYIFNELKYYNSDFDSNIKNKLDQVYNDLHMYFFYGGVIIFFYIIILSLESVPWSNCILLAKFLGLLVDWVKPTYILSIVLFFIGLLSWLWEKRNLKICSWVCWMLFVFNLLYRVYFI